MKILFSWCEVMTVIKNKHDYRVEYHNTKKTRLGNITAPVFNVQKPQAL